MDLRISPKAFELLTFVSVKAVPLVSVISAWPKLISAPSRDSSPSDFCSARKLPLDSIVLLLPRVRVAPMVALRSQPCGWPTVLVSPAKAPATDETASRMVMEKAVLMAAALADDCFESRAPEVCSYGHGEL